MIKKFFNHSLVKNSTIYFLFNGLNSSIPFLLLPVLTKYLSPAEYGIIAIFQVSIYFTIPLIGFNMGMNIDRNFFKREKKELSILIFNMLFILSNTFLISTFVLFVLMKLFPDLIGIPEYWVYWLPLIAAMIIINEFNLILLRNNNKALHYGVWQLGLTLLNISASLLLIIVYRMGWEGRLYGISLANIIIGILSLYSIYKQKYLYFTINIKEIKETLQVCTPLIFHTLGAMIFFYSDRFFLDKLVGKDAVGIYSIGYSFGAIVVLFQDAVAKSTSPWIYKNLSQISPEGKKKMVRFTYIYNLLMLTIAVLITFVSYFLIDIMTTKDYHSAKEFILWISLGFAFNGMYKMVGPYFIHLGKTSKLATLTFITAIINIVSNYFLIRTFGPLGAAYACCFSFFASYLLAWIWSHRLYPMPWLMFLKR